MTLIAAPTVQLVLDIHKALTWYMLNKCKQIPVIEMSCDVIKNNDKHDQPFSTILVLHNEQEKRYVTIFREDDVIPEDDDCIVSLSTAEELENRISNSDYAYSIHPNNITAIVELAYNFLLDGVRPIAKRNTRFNWPD